MTRIVVTEPDGFATEARDVLKTLGPVAEASPDGHDVADLLADAEVAWVRFGAAVDDSFLASAPVLRYLVTATTGLDHIDLDACAARGVEVLSLRGETEFLRTIPSTAEHTWALLLALVRRIPWAHESVLAGEWDRDRFRGHQLAGQTLGLLGVGRVGTIVARYGNAFGMQVLAHDPDPEVWPDGVQPVGSVGDLIAASDVVSVHVPLDASTHGLIGRRELERARPTAVLLNTSRGEIVVEHELIDALESHHLAGAALDVLAGEFEPARKSALVQFAQTHDNLVLSPHIGGATVEAMRSTEIFMAEKLRTTIHCTEASR